MKTQIIFPLTVPGAFSAANQSYSIDGHKIVVVGTSSNSQYTISGTLGQHDAPDVSGLTAPTSDVGFTGGFWTLIPVVQIPGAPTLSISHSDNTMTVFWQEVPGWSLQKNSDLSTTHWMASSEIINNDGTNNFNIVNQPTGKRCYRLIKPSNA